MTRLPQTDTELYTVVGKHILPCADKTCLKRNQCARGWYHATLLKGRVHGVRRLFYDWLSNCRFPGRKGFLAMPGLERK